MRSWIRFAAAAAVFAALASGCTREPIRATEGAGAADGAGFAAESAPRWHGGTMRIGIAAVASLDPALATGASQSQNLLADLLYDGLTAYDPAGGRVVGAVARSWSVSGDGLTWSFRIDPAARFSDGRPITAPDVKASIERVIALGVKSVSGVRLTTVQGAPEFVDKKTTGGVRGIVAVDPAVLEIHLSSPMSTLAELLADPAFGIVPDGTSTDPAAFAGRPRGSGPFSVDQRTDSALSLARSVGSDAQLDRVELRTYADAAAAYAGFVAGEVDATIVPPNDAAAAKQHGAQVLAASEQVSVFYGMNLASSALSSLPLRQAILKSVDREAIRAKYFDGLATVMTGVIGPGAVGRRDNGCGTACTYDPAAATALVQAAFPGAAVPTVHLDYFDEPTGREAGVAGDIAGYLRAVGIPAEVRGHTFDEFQTVPTSGTAELFRFGWIGSYPSGDAYLASLFESKGTDNVFSVADATLDTEIVKARAELDESARVTHELAAEDRVFALAVLLPIAQYTTRLVASQKVQDLVLGPNGSFDAAKVWLAL
ncbi:MAG TPA: ABC transporter substrate-binding protein [Acidimicrobiales bacterium]|nr:ABC transporter substrate-binding protein [Acidimicrobiales bacterium]